MDINFKCLLAFVDLVCCHSQLSWLQILKTRTLSGPMGRKATVLAQAGQVAEKDGGYRAHVQYTGSEGQNAQLTGPRRLERDQASADLASMRAAAAVFPNDRVRAFQAMHAEARRIQERVKYAKEIEAAMLSRTPFSPMEG